MASSEQLRALTALRDALQLCEDSGVLISARDAEIDGRHRQELTVGGLYYYSHDSFLTAETIGLVIAASESGV